MIQIALMAGMFALFAQSQDENLINQFDRKIKIKSASLDSIKIELERGRDRIKELNKKEGSFLEQLEQLEKNIQLSQVYISNISKKIDTISLHIDTLKDSLSIVSKALEQRQDKMKQRLRNIYKTGYPKIGEIILTSRNISDMLHRVKYFQELNTYDKMLMRSIDSTKAIINEHKIALETEQKQLTSLKTKKEKEKFEREHEQKSREIMLANIKSEKDAYISMVKELERAQEELNILVERLIRKRKKAKTEYEQGLEIAFEKRKSKLPWPIEGPVIRKFGKIVHPIYKTVTMSNGLDIKASEGEAVLCVAPGQIDYIGWMRGYGKFVIVNHFGGYLTIYGHMNRIDVATDQKVKYGTVLGIVGDTGSLNGVKLHFQIRKSTETLNPQDWLEKKE